MYSEGRQKHWTGLTSFFRAHFGTKWDMCLLIDWRTLLSLKPSINLENLEAPLSVEEINAATMDLAAEKTLA